MHTQATTFLTRILDHKCREVEQRKASIPQRILEQRLADAPPVRDLALALRQPGRAALIAEVKKASPSRGVLIERFDPLELAGSYAANGASAISVLTDSHFFQGELSYLSHIRAALAGRVPGSMAAIPLLRKDFLIDPYQIYEARAAGADALLLIVAALDDARLAELLRRTGTLGMRALVEVHDEHELDRALAAGAQIIGVNNRNLHTFETSLATTERLAERLAAHTPPADRPVLVSESGIHSAAHVAKVRAWGADAILVGEALVTAPDIGARARELSGMTALT
jgi:indole-3-glycerol phosphate synthase